MMEEYYVDLISNSNHLHSQDTNTNFTTVSKTPPNLSEYKRYVVGLESINIPNAFDFINPDSCYITLITRELLKKDITITISSAETFLEEINCELKQYSLRLAPNLEQDHYSLTEIGVYRGEENEFMITVDDGVFGVLISQFVRGQRGELIFQKPGTLEGSVSYYEEKTHRVSLEPSSSTPQALLDNINSELKKLLGTSTPIFALTPEHHVRYAGVSNPTKVGSFKTMQMSDHLAAILGYRTTRVFDSIGKIMVEPENTISEYEESARGKVADESPDLRAGFRYAFVYCDITEDSLVGGEQAPLLNIVPIDTEKKMISYRPTNISYKRLTRRNLDTIKLYITTETGLNIKYNNRTSPITTRLHIREVGGNV
jgi:hypothetical protein